MVFLEEFKNGITVFLLSMTPFGEVRLGIPIGIALFKLNPLVALAWGILGNITISLILLKFLDPVVSFIFRHSPLLTRIIKKYFDRLHTKHGEAFNRKGAFLLTLFVGVPLPGTGAWAGSALAYLFNIPLKLSLPAISFGIAIAAIIVAFGTQAVVALASLLQA